MKQSSENVHNDLNEPLNLLAKDKQTPNLCKKIKYSLHVNCKHHATYQ